MSLSAAVVLAVGACGGDDDDEAPPLDPAAVKAAIEEEIEVTQFCELGQLALASGEAVTCPAVTTTEKGLVEGDLVLTREGDEEELAYEISMSGPGGNKFGGGTINVTEEGPPTDDDEAVAGGSPLERELSGSLDGAEVSCSPAKPPAKGETVICTASGEDEDGEGFEGEVIVKPSPGAGAIGAEYSYEARLEKEGGGTRFTGGVFSLD